MRKNNSIRERAKRVPLETKVMVAKSIAIAKCIRAILDDKDMTQRDLADLLNKKESEISKWMSGTHNFTLKSIAKIEAVLGSEIVFTADKVNKQLNIISLLIGYYQQSFTCDIPTGETYNYPIEELESNIAQNELLSLTIANNSSQLMYTCID